MPETLTRARITETAKRHGVEPAALAAVTQVESSGKGYLANGQPKILFERHILWKRLQIPDRKLNPRPLSAARPDLCHPAWDRARRHYLGGVREYDRVAGVTAWAQEHDLPKWESYKKAAYESCSWGLFQLMGFHYKLLGYDGIYDMVHAFRDSEAAQLEGVMKFLAASRCLDELQSKNWSGFARIYNGDGQVAVYGPLLQRAYAAGKKAGW